MAYIEMPGANIYHEFVGAGPMLLCISGADGSCEIWRAFAENLKQHFTVVMWDRRGFSRSHLTGAQDYEHRIDTDVDDAARLIKHFSPNEPATVMGNSSGAIISLRLVLQYPDLIRTLIPYEPPAATLLPDFEELWNEHEIVYNTYRKSGAHPALEKFANLTKTDQNMVRTLMDFSRPYLFSNLQYWFEREFMYYPKTPFHAEKDFGPLKDKLLIVDGELSPREAYQYRANETLAKELGLELHLFPGEHVGHLTHAGPFAQKLVEALKAKDEFYTKI